MIGTGFQPGVVTTVADVERTAFDLALMGHRVVYLSLGERGSDIAIRIASAKIGVKPVDVASGRLTAADMSACEDALRADANAPLWIYDKPLKTVAEVEDKAAYALATYSPAFICIADIERIAGDESEVAASIDALAKRLAIPLIVNETAADRAAAASWSCFSDPVGVA